MRPDYKQLLDELLAYRYDIQDKTKAWSADDRVEGYIKAKALLTTIPNLSTLIDSYIEAFKQTSSSTTKPSEAELRKLAIIEGALLDTLIDKINTENNSGQQFSTPANLDELVSDYQEAITNQAVNQNNLARQAAARLNVRLQEDLRRNGIILEPTEKSHLVSELTQIISNKEATNNEVVTNRKLIATLERVIDKVKSDHPQVKMELEIPTYTDVAYNIVDDYSNKLQAQRYSNTVHDTSERIVEIADPNNSLKSNEKNQLRKSIVALIEEGTKNKDPLFTIDERISRTINNFIPAATSPNNSPETDVQAKITDLVVNALAPYSNSNISTTSLNANQIIKENLSQIEQAKSDDEKGIEFKKQAVAQVSPLAAANSAGTITDLDLRKQVQTFPPEVQNTFLGSKVENVVDALQKDVSLLLEQYRNENPDFSSKLHPAARTAIQNTIISEVLKKISGITSTDQLQPVILSTISSTLEEKLTDTTGTKTVYISPGSSINAQIESLATKISKNNDLRTIAVLSSVAPYISIVEDVTENMPMDENRRLGSFRTLRKGNASVTLTDELTLFEDTRDEAKASFQEFLAKIGTNLSDRQIKDISDAVIESVYGKLDINEEEQLVRIPGLLNRDFTNLTYEQKTQLANLSSDTERVAFLAQFAPQRQNMVYDALSIELNKYIRNKLKNPEALKRFSELTLKDVYSPAMLEALKKQASLDGKNFNPNDKITFKQALQIAIENSKHFENFQKQMIKTELASIKSGAQSPWHYAAEANLPFTSSLYTLYSITNPDYAAKNLQRFLTANAVNAVALGFNTFGISKEYSSLTWIAHAGTASGAPRTQLSLDINKLMTKGLAINKIKELEDIPKDWSLIDRIRAQSIIRRLKAIEKSEEELNNNPRLNWIVSKWTNYNNKKKTAIGQYGTIVLKSALNGRWDILPGMVVKSALRLSINKFLENKSFLGGTFEYRRDKNAMVWTPWEYAKEQVRFGTKKILIKAWSSTGKKAVGFLSKTALTFTRRILQTAVGKVIQNIAKVIVRVIKTVVKPLIKLALVAIPIIGWILGLIFLLKKLIGFIPGFIRDYIKLQLLIYAVRFINFMVGIFSFFSFLNPANWSLPAAGSLAFKSFIPATGNIGFDLGLRWGISYWTPRIPAFFSSLSTNWAAFKANFASMASSLQSVIATFVKNLGALGAAGAITFTVVGIYTWLDQTNKSIALHETTEKLTGESPINPLQLIKTANPTEIPDSPAGKEITYTLKLTTPPCAPVINVYDTPPESVTYVPGSIGYDPKPPEKPVLSIIPDESTSHPLKWTINLDPSVANPANCQTGKVYISGSLDFRAGNTPESVNALKKELSSSPTLQYYFFRNLGDAIVEKSNKSNINAWTMAAIFFAESHLGEELGGNGIAGPKGIWDGKNYDGCFNPSGILVSGLCNNNECPSNGTGRSSGFCQFSSYIEPINITGNTINNRLNDISSQNNIPPNSNLTVEYFASKYIPANVHKNCQEWESGLENQPIGCVRGLNASWKQTVACTVVEKHFCTWSINQYLSFKNGDPSPSASGSVPASSNPFTLNLTYKVTVNSNVTSDCIRNDAHAVMGTINAVTSTVVSVGGKKCSEIPAPPSDIAAALCSNEYKICPTKHSTATRDWTQAELFALWNVANKIKLNPHYYSLAVGNYTVEVQKAHCITGDTECNYWYGQYENINNPPVSTLPNVRLIKITDTASAKTSTNQKLAEWLYAHELGHSASWGLSDGRVAANKNADYDLVNNERSRCKEDGITGYGSTSISENNAEGVSIFMTHTESIVFNYNGSQRNLKYDFVCQYNAIQSGYFAGQNFEGF